MYKNKVFRPDGVPVSVNGSATQPDEEYAELIVSWDFDPGLVFKLYVREWRPKMFLAPGTEPNYFILDTDYTSYSIVWDCKENADDSHKGKLEC